MLSQIQKPIHHRQVDNGRLGKQELNNQIAMMTLLVRGELGEVHTLGGLRSHAMQRDPPD